MSKPGLAKTSRATVNRNEGSVLQNVPVISIAASARVVAPRDRTIRLATIAPRALRDRLFSSIPAAAAAALIGASLALMPMGLSAAFAPALDAAGVDRWLVVAAVLWSTALGIALPQRLALGAGRTAWEQFGRGRLGAESDLRLQWMALASASLLAGLLIAGLPWLARGALEARDVLYGHFVWSVVVRDALHFGLVVVAAAPPALCIGLAFTCAHHVQDSGARWNPRATATALLGAGVAMRMGAAVSGRPEALLLSASLPLLAIAALAGFIGTQPDRPPRRIHESHEPLPERSDKRPRMLRAAVVVMGVVLAAAAVGVGKAVVAGHETAHGAGLAIAIASLGAFLGVGRRFAVTHSLLGFGLAAVATGLVGTFASLVDTASLRSSWAGDWSKFAAMGLAGFALGVGTSAVVECVADRGRIGAKTAARMIFYAALSLGILRHVPGFAEPSVMIGSAGVTATAMGVLILLSESATAMGRRGLRHLLTS